MKRFENEEERFQLTLTYFSIYQAMTGGGIIRTMDYPSDFFDLIVIDRCQRVELQ